MSGSRRFPTYHVPDDGIPYAPGDIVSIDQSAGHAEIIKDPNGDYEVLICRRATEYVGDRPLLRIGLRKRMDEPIGPPDFWSVESPPHW